MKGNERLSSLYWEGITEEEELEQIDIRKYNYKLLSEIINLSFKLIVNTPRMDKEEHKKYQNSADRINNTARKMKEQLRDWADEVGDWSL